MELINQHTKRIMEECKAHARDAGLQFEDESLEYIVTNRDLLELSPKVMIPTLYDYWVFDVDVLKEKGKYDLYPSNPYETVINTRPAISFYNDNNPDWLNVMIFYHVLGHIDFFQNNIFFSHTWNYDFAGRALSDKRLISKLRAKHGRWVDYVIEFSRGIDNTVSFFKELSDMGRPPKTRFEKKLDYYFDLFLQKEQPLAVYDYIKEINRYNDTLKAFPDSFEDAFFSSVTKKYPEFESLYAKYADKRKSHSTASASDDLMQYILKHSEFLKKEQNRWMKSVIQVVRNTSLFFQPQIRTKIMNEGWASYWHETLFLKDKRIRGREVSYARINSGVTTMPRVGLNPYALGLQLFRHIEENADKGKLSYDFSEIKNIAARDLYDKKTNSGRETIFRLRREFSDPQFLSRFIDQDFVDKNDLFVSGKRLNRNQMAWEYYVKSRDADDYKQMMLETLYHPPLISIKGVNASNNELQIVHRFENKGLMTAFIANTMMGIEYLWGGPVSLDTYELDQKKGGSAATRKNDSKNIRVNEFEFKPVRYRMENKKLTKKDL